MVGPLGESPKPLRFAPVDVATVRENRGWFLAIGVASMVLGVLAFLLPFVAPRATAIALGWLIVLAGVVEGSHAIQSRGWAGAGGEFVSALVQVAFGLLLVLSPMTGKLALMVIAAAYFVAEGALKLIRAYQHRGLRGSGWLVFDGVLSLALGILILTGGVTTAVRVLGLLVGISLLTGGMSMILIALGAARVLHTRA
ncbi:HdeD family acid-resistance protein [Sorangium atrum]|uniref:HdeD family acid-resistance protein n=1 Tax=Sorangium atrum TaxID=2995308 RepID=A0ABT5CEP5_9BACT|nr:HdeD family acid-resistance protein [Sorangium aterium]MDC0684902.1 HdeD family acid-resistance protein [Sorangium aterium]